MRYKLLLGAEPGGQQCPGERIMTPADERLAGDAVGAAGLQWLWGMVELHLGEAEPETAA